VNLVIQMIVWTPFYFLAPRAQILVRAEILVAQSSLWLLRQDRPPAEERHQQAWRTCLQGSFILAPKHQSFWDVHRSSFPIMQDPIYILKRELTLDPLLRLVHHEACA
jgi:1-acyl-sn-glycerol-3-phosphate acyltransferase